MKIDPLVEKFRPPTYYEVKTGKKYRARIGRTKYVYQVNPFSAVAMVRFHEVGHAIIDGIEKAARKRMGEEGFSGSSVQIIRGLVALVGFLWEIGDKPNGLIKRWLMRRQFFKVALSDTEWTLRIAENVKSANSRIAFFFETPGELLAGPGQAVGGDGFYSITRGHGEPNQTPWVEYLFVREAEKLDTINKWKADQRSRQEAQRNRRK